MASELVSDELLTDAAAMSAIVLSTEQVRVEVRVIRVRDRVGVSAAMSAIVLSTEQMGTQP